jgi:hypothetical protein
MCICRKPLCFLPKSRLERELNRTETVMLLVCCLGAREGSLSPAGRNRLSCYAACVLAEGAHRSAPKCCWVLVIWRAPEKQVSHQLSRNYPQKLMVPSRS